MRPSGHFYSGLTFWFIIFIINNSYNYFDTFLFITAIIALDLDYLGKFIFVEQNHRRYLSHSLTLWIFLVAGAFFFNLDFVFWISLGFLVHVLVDTIDWGIYLFPKKESRVSPHLLKLQDSLKTEKDFSKVYWENRIILLVELVLFQVSLSVIAYLIFLPLNSYLLIYFISLFVITTGLSFIDYINSKN